MQVIHGRAARRVCRAGGEQGRSVAKMVVARAEEMRVDLGVIDVGAYESTRERIFADGFD